MKILELNHVAIHVTDVERSCRFYREILRLEPMPRPAFDFPGAWFRLGSSQELHLIGHGKGFVDSQRRGNHFALLVEALDPWETHFKRLKFVYDPPKPRPDGAMQLFLSDPDGHTIELFNPQASNVIEISKS